jgi:hypothetical protein
MTTLMTADKKCHTLTIADKYIDMFPNGTVLWRATEITNGKHEHEPVNFDFHPTERGTVMCRMQFLDTTGWEPQIHGTMDEDGHPTTGMVVFLDIPPDDDWTHLIVQGCSKKMKEPIGPDGGKNDRGMCLFAKSAKPYKMKDYLAFREKLTYAKKDNIHYDIEQALAVTRDLWPIEQRSNERRLLVERSLHDDNPQPLYDWAHLFYGR